MRIIFMGTPDFAVSILKILHDNKKNVVAVVSQPDKPKNRGKKLLPTPVKQKALEYGYKILQSDKIIDMYEQLEELEPDIIIVAAYGQILPAKMLKLPKYGCINAHASLLPKYRGAAPIQYALMNGEKITGVTVMQMDNEMDTGDMLYKETVKIEPEDDLSSLTLKLSEAGQKAIISVINMLESGQKIIPEKQDNTQATYTHLIKKEMCRINWNKTAEEIRNLIRAVPAYTFYNEENIKLFTPSITNIDTNLCNPGEITEVDKEGFYVSTLDTALYFKEIQFPGKKRMLIREFLKGNTLKKSTILK